MKSTLILFCILIFGCAQIGKNKNQFDYIVINDKDYGILNKQDVLFAYQQYGQPVAKFGDQETWGGAYWQCHPVKVLKVSCNISDGDKPGEKMADLDVSLNFENQIETYAMRRIWDDSVCRRIVDAIQKLIKDESHFCILGSLWLEDKSSNVGHKQVNWMWDAFKTKKGCYAYWGQETGCEPDLNLKPSKD